MFPLTGTLRGKRLGILGLGNIGKAIARRAGPFGLEVLYHGRSRQDVHVGGLLLFCRYLVNRGQHDLTIRDFRTQFVAEQTPRGHPYQRILGYGERECA